MKTMRGRHSRSLWGPALAFYEMLESRFSSTFLVSRSDRSYRSVGTTQLLQHPRAGGAEPLLVLPTVEWSAIAISKALETFDSGPSPPAEEFSRLTRSRNPE